MEGILKDVKNRFQQNYDYISNDPEENADNFDPKWASFRELNTDEQRYQAIRKRWGNADIPDPQINLTCRRIKKDCESEGAKACNTENEENNPASNSTNVQNCLPKDEPNRKQASRRRSISCTRLTEWDSKSKEDCPSTSNSSVPNVISTPVWPLAARNRNRQVSRRRSRSCTRPYERLISDLERNYKEEYSQLIYKHSKELQGMLQFHTHRLGAFTKIFEHCSSLRTNLKIQQDKEMLKLLTNQYNEVNNLLGERKENIEACVRYMEEVKAFFTFYQKINDCEVTLQMTDEQYEHTMETERMYALYSNFYR